MCCLPTPIRGQESATTTTETEATTTKPNEPATPSAEINANDADHAENEEETEAKDPTKELIRAVTMRDREKIKDLLADGADINAQDERGLTPYLAAKISGSEQIATMLEVLGAKTKIDFDPKEFISNSLKKAEKEDHPGAVALIAKGDEIIFAGAAGEACIAHDTAITTETKFRIGSVSKQFTAAAILKLQEDGKLNVQDKLSKFIPDFPRGDEVTLHHLLTHTSGLKNYTSHPDFFETVEHAVEMSEMVEKFKSEGFDSEPGEKFEYCNTGYFLLSYIIEKVSGSSFGEYLDRTFFQPLEMHDTGTHDSTTILKHEAFGYSMNDETVEKALDWDMSRARGAGDIYSTVGDLHKWNRGVFGGKVLRQESLKAAHTVHLPEGIATGDAKGDDGEKKAPEVELEMPYGYGWMMDKHRGLTRIGHSGGLNGFVTQLNYYPDKEVTVVAMHNAFPSIGEFTPSIICDRMAEVFLWPEMKARPKYEIAQDIDFATYDDYVGQYDYRSAIMTISRDGDKLMAELTGQPKLEIFPAAKDKFFWKVVDAQADFQRDDDGKVTGVRHAQGIAKFLAPRIQPRKAVELSTEVLDRYVGKYKYGFGRLTIRREGEQLFAQMTGQPEFELFAESEMKLFWKVINAQLEFKLDDDGKVVSAKHYQAGQEIPVEKIE